jgi:hypothetical protein
MADALDFLRQDALRKRVNGVAGGNRIIWQDKDLIDIHNHVMSARPEQIIRATQPTEVKFSKPDVDKASLAKIGIELRSDIGPDDNPLFIITTPRIDLAGDSNNTANVDTSDFLKNSMVLDTHDSSKPPVAVSTRPWLSGSSMLAIAKFPKPGVSGNSDQIASAVRARLLKGASIGFIPLSWSFTKDPARPLGVDFKAIKLLEWSICALPCNPDCLMIGSVSGATTAPVPSDAKMAERRREARELAAKARALSESISNSVPLTREQRVAEAQALCRSVMAGRK